MKLGTPIGPEKLAGLPRWAFVALLSRCGRQLLHLHSSDAYEPEEQRVAVRQAISLSELRAQIGGAAEASDEAYKVKNQYFDSYDLDALHSSICAGRGAALNTYADIGSPEADIPLVLFELAVVAFEAAFARELSGNEQDMSERAAAASDVLGMAIGVSPEVAPRIVADYERIASLAQTEGWDDLTPVAPSVFGGGWPVAIRRNVSFRPRARLIRTIGDRLVSGPEAAVIELIKNSHDADASFVRVTFVPPLGPGGGSIVVEDDGHGMSLDDIEQKWMEPATDEKRNRRTSPSGRALLGSKGIGRFATSRLGRYLELVTTASSPIDSKLYTTRIPRIDWNQFDSVTYLEDVGFEIETLPSAPSAGTRICISDLRDTWSESGVTRLYEELRRLISPLQNPDEAPFKIFLDLSLCTPESSGFDGKAMLRAAASSASGDAKIPEADYLVRPYPLLDACDYVVDGVFDEVGNFSGFMEIRRASLEPQKIELSVPFTEGESRSSCGIVLVRLHIFDREASAVRATAEKAGLGSVGIRDARRLLDSIAGVSIYREGFRIRPYGDKENDWLSLDTKRVQNPSMRIGRNQVAGIVTIDDEDSSRLIERSSREGLEENDSFRRLQKLILGLLAEVVEPRRRVFRVNAGLEARRDATFKGAYNEIQLARLKQLFDKLPATDRADAEAVVKAESDRLSTYLKRLEERQAQLEAKVTMGLIVGEVMHQGNTPLSFMETETARLQRWWPSLLDDTPRASENRGEVPRILNGMSASAGSLRVLFDALSPLSGARRGVATPYDPRVYIDKTVFLFNGRMARAEIDCTVTSSEAGRRVVGYPDDLATAITNLFDNSIYWLIHHQVTDPKVLVDISFDATHCKIVVEDNGGGVPLDLLDHVFDVGFTLKPNGTGLGLSIAREAISRSGGQMTAIESKGGARFQIVLPAEPSS